MDDVSFPISLLEEFGLFGLIADCGNSGLICIVESNTVSE